jgi:hypothetical protein
MSRKVIFYIKGTDRNIVITDDCSDGITDEELAKKISLQLASTSIGWFETDGDIVLGFPGEIAAVHIQKSTKLSKETTKKEYSFGNSFTTMPDIEEETQESDIEEIDDIELLDEDDIIKLDDVTEYDDDEKVINNEPRTSNATVNPSITPNT